MTQNIQPNFDDLSYDFFQMQIENIAMLPFTNLLFLYFSLEKKVTLFLK